MTDRLREARRRRDEGIAHAEQGMRLEWARLAWGFLLVYLTEHPTMHSDELWESGLPGTRENRALGPLIQRARNRGYIVPSGQYEPSIRGHAQPRIVWRSLLYDPALRRHD